MNEYKYYLLFNPELKNLNRIELRNSYLKDIETNHRITSIESFFNKYPKFNIQKYKENYSEISSYIEILIHASRNNDIKEYQISEEKQSFEEYNIEPESNENKIIDESSKNTAIAPIKKQSNIKLAHVFVHFFKIGGGESYISNFNIYNDIFDETLFVNSNHSHDTLFKYDSKIVYYKSYEELNLLLVNFDIIIDHQLYWFEKKISDEAFLNIIPNKIIRIIHGVPIHYEDITSRNFYYSIELYNDINSHNSWNNHIKIYNNIGVKIPENIPIKNFNNNNINIAVVGRINEEKVSIKFLNILLRFLDFNKKYKFNFYGLIDDKYLKFFNIEIKKSKNIIYHGIIDPSEIHNVYINNDILVHPSLYEAGATVVLEAMSYGLPVLCRNSGGLPNALRNDEFLCNNDNEFFEKLLKINNDNYHKLYYDNRLKILNYNNEETLFKKLINELKLIYDIEKKNDIPNIIHYVYGLEKQTEEFYFVYYLSILSNVLINKPDIIYFHYQYLPYGYWWDKALKYIKLNYVNANNLMWGKKKINKFAHKADKIRLEMLYKYGGIYMDIDTITYSSYNYLLKYDFVIGIQEENYKTETKDNITLYCNAILLSKKDNIFIKEWINNYEKSFNPGGWCEASVHLPYYIFKKISASDKKNIKILNKECFYYPSYNETEKIFENSLSINKNLITLHLWNSYSEKYYGEITNFNWCYTNNSLYSKLMKNILNKYTELQVDNTENKANEKKILSENHYNTIKLNKIFNISIILYEEVFKENNYINTIYSIINKDYFYYLNIEIIIFDNSSELLNAKILRRLLYEKNIDIKIIKLNKVLNRNTLLNIGIKYSKNNLIFIHNSHSNIQNNKIINQCVLFDSYQSNDNKISVLSDLYSNKYNIDVINKLSIIDILDNKDICINLDNIIFDKKLINYNFPEETLHEKESNIIFTIINLLDNKNIKFNTLSTNSNRKYEKSFHKIRTLISNNIKDNNNNIKNIYFERVYNIIYNTYYKTKNNYLEHIISIINI